MRSSRATSLAIAPSLPLVPSSSHHPRQLGSFLFPLTRHVPARLCSSSSLKNPNRGDISTRPFTCSICNCNCTCIHARSSQLTQHACITLPSLSLSSYPSHPISSNLTPPADLPNAPLSCMASHGTRPVKPMSHDPPHPHLPTAFLIAS